MKYFLMAVFASVISGPLWSQKLTTDILPGTSSLYETYLKKADRKSKAARTLKYVAIGSAVTSGIFFVMANRESKNNPDEMFSGMGEGIVGFGFGAIAVGSGLTSLFLHSSAKKYKKAAMTITPAARLQSIAIPDSRARPIVGAAVVLSF